MRIAIVTSLDNEVGLKRDHGVLRRLLEGAGHEVVGIDFRKPRVSGSFDLAIFLEVFDPALLDLAPRLWAVPNPEWWFASWTPDLPRFEAVLCKTQDAERIFSGLGARAMLVGFGAEDRFDASVPRQRRFLHVAGQSELKGTEAVLGAWEQHAIPHPLTIVARKLKLTVRSKAVTLLRRVSDLDLRKLQNECAFSLQPSQYEGFGHVLHEALSCGAILATTAAPPMDQVRAPFLIVPTSFAAKELAQLARVDADGVRDAVEKMWAATDADVEGYRSEARENYLTSRAGFEQAFLSLVKGASRPATGSGDRRPLPMAEPPSEPPLGAVDSVPRLTIVLPAHRSGAELVLRTVMALRWQTSEPGAFEVVIAADGGDPNGGLALAALAATDPSRPGRAFACRVVESPRPRGDVPHRNHARNAGWRAGRGTLCWMLDADFLLPPHAVEHLLAEHDKAIAIGRPAVFSPCLSGVGAIGPEAWISKSSVWVTSGDRADYESAIDCGPVSPAWGGYPERYSGPSAPASSLLADLPEGMPVLWRVLLEALDGFDEGFGEWGGDKEELVDRVKGCARAGLLEVRLLSSVRALHQPHTIDAQAFSPEARPRTRERERRARLITTLATWWRVRLDKVRVALEASGLAGGPVEIQQPSQYPAGVPLPPDLASVVLRQLQARSRRDQSSCLVVGRWAHDLSISLSVGGVNASECSLTDLARISHRSLKLLVIVDVLAGLTGDDFPRTVAEVKRACAEGAAVVFVERTKMGSRGGSGLRAPMDFQRLFKGLSVAGQRSAKDEVFTVLAGRLVA